MEMSSIQSAISTHVVLNLMFKLFFKYSDDFLLFWMDDLLIYSWTEEEHLKHIHLVFESV